MLTGITLENFKAFKEPQFIPIKPITLVFGPNSAGKSSILHALAFLKYVHSSYGHCDPETVEYGWDKIHLGSWHNLVHGHDATATMRITLHFENCAIMWAFKKCKHGPRVDSFVLLENKTEIARGDNKEKDAGIPLIQWSIKLHASHPFWNVFREEIWDLATGERESQKSADDFAADHELLESSSKAAKDNPIKHFRSVFDAHFNNWIADSWKKVPDQKPRYSTPYREEMQTLFPGLDELFFTQGPNHYWQVDDEDDENLRLNEQNLVGKLFPSETILRQIGEFGESLMTATTDQESADLIFDSILGRRRLHSLISMKSIQEMFPGQNDNPVTRPQHVGAFRSAPGSKLTRNNMADRPDLKPWFQLMDGITIDFVNGSLEKLQIPYRIAIRKIQISAFSPDEENCEDPTKAEVRHCDDEIVFRDENNVSHPIRSLGSGLGVILPILVALATEHASFLSIEEPESHIHPKLQAELGDIVIDSTLSGQFLRHGLGIRTFIETHSEHLLLRIMRRMRQTYEERLPEGIQPVIPEDVALLFVSPGTNGSVVQEIGLNERGELIKAWPGGFFEEGFNEMFD
jgi:hypothetical protein